MSKYDLEYVFENYAFMDPEIIHGQSSRWSTFPKGVSFGQVFDEELRQIYLDAYKENPLRYSSLRKYIKGDGIKLDEASAKAVLEDLKAREELDLAVAEFNAALDKAESIANKHNLDFDISPAYGMGGTYSGKDREWQSSSNSC